MIQAEVRSGQLRVGRVDDLTVRLSNTGPGTCTNIFFKLALPAHIVLVRGSKGIEVVRLRNGESVDRTVQVLPEAAGSWAATSKNFSYRDQFGSSVRVSDFQAPLTVVPAAPVVAEPEPSFTIRLTTRELASDRWQALKGVLANAGAPRLNDVSVTISGPVTVDSHSRRRDLGTIPGGAKKEFDFYVRAQEGGGQVPVHLTTTYATDTGSTRFREDTVPVQVGGETRHRSRDLTKILYLSANPTETQRLDLAREQRQIDQTLRLGRERDHIELRTVVATRVSDLTQALIEFEPRVVHFSGHGTSDGRLYLETEYGRTALIPVEGLAALFKEVAYAVQCVIVNACDSEDLARALVGHIDSVIGMRHSIGDQAAILFSTGFYQALAAGKEIDEAFRLGCVHIQLHSRVEHEHATPLLLRKS